MVARLYGGVGFSLTDRTGDRHLGYIGNSVL